MRVLLAANACHVPPRGGATRGNLAWLDRLAASGHECRVVGALPADAGGPRAGDEEAAAESLPGVPGAVRRGPLLVFSAADGPPRVELLAVQIREFRPDWVLVSSEDVGQILFAEAEREAPGRVVYLAHTPQFFPFGPESWHPNQSGAELVRNAAERIVIGGHMAGYFERHLGVRPPIAHPPIYGPGPWPDLSRPDDGLVTMINPCAIKGLAILVELARRRPDVAFGALPGWGTTIADRRALASLPNVRLLPNRRSIEDVLCSSRVLLVPSLWYEGFGLIVTEAMLRGIPVLASDSGGLREAKQGTRFVLPVRPIERYQSDYDERGLPRAVLPPQDLAPWEAALRALLADRALYRDESQRSREAATRFVRGLDPEALEKRLREMGSRPSGRAVPRETLGPRPRPAARPLRILLAHNSPFFPAQGGGDRSNRLLVAALASRGHVCRAFARLGRLGPPAQEEYLKGLAGRGVSATSIDAGLVAFHLDGVEVRVLAGDGNPRAAFVREIDAFAPELILASTDDPAQLLLEAALAQGAARVVYLARAPLALPFGPASAFPSATKTDALRRVDAVVGVSEYVAEYVRQWGGISAVHRPISPMEPGPYPELGRIENEFVTLVNPCAVKGIAIFLELADRMRDVRFAAVPTWGTTEEDRRALAARDNVDVLPAVERINELLARTRVLLVPSLWAEARSRVVVEAMLRGVPVLAAEVGGLGEAMMGVPHLLPVRPITRYRPDLDERMVPLAEVPAQDVMPWETALRRLLSDRGRYQELSRLSRAAAEAYVARSGVAVFEELLREIVARPPLRPGRVRSPVETPSRGPLERLSPEKRELLALRLAKRGPAPSGAGPERWFPALAMRPGASLRLFCLPHAGAGVSAFRTWSQAPPARAQVCPVQLPGRETRVSEPPFREMPGLVEALGAALRPHAGTPYALFGHSFGAGVVFELTRWLRRHECPLPSAIVVSGARAPQLRTRPAAEREPSREEWLAELRDRGGLPAEAFADADWLRLVLPTLEADARLYRDYVYTPEAPLAVPIFAYGGAEDPHVTPEHLEGWRAQTIAAFRIRTFPGGHFFLRAHAAVVLAALAEDLDGVLRSGPAADP